MPVTGAAHDPAPTNAYPRLAVHRGATAGARWHSADLAQLIDRALDAAEAMIAHLSLSAPTMHLAVHNADAPLDTRAFETAVLLRAVAAVPEAQAPGVARRAHELARQLIPHARHPRTAIACALHPARARDHAAARVVLTAMGYPDERVDRALTIALTSNTATARERLPHQDLEHAWLAWLAGGPAVPDDLPRRTAACRGIDLLNGRRADMQALSRAVVYATDFGRAVSPVIVADAVAAQADGALAGALDDGDLVLAGELLLVWPCLRVPWSPAAAVAFATLAGVDLQAAPVVAPVTDRSTDEYATGTRFAARSTTAARHVAYALGALCATILHARHHPPRQPRASTRSAQGVDTSCRALRAEVQHSHWLDHIAILSPEQRAGCEPLVRDVALRRALRRFELAEAKQLLQLSTDSCIPTSALSTQAAGILRRIASCSALVVAH